jgi:ubiquinone biosynthesis protein
VAGQSARLASVAALLAAELVSSRKPEQGERSVRRARLVRERLEGLGPFYVKVGQVLASRPDLVPQTICVELGRLHDQVRPDPFPRIERVLEAELGTGWRREFSDVDIARPLGSASLAQAYAVILKDGRQAVLKVQRPGVRERVLADMAGARRLAWMIGHAAPRMTEVFDLEATLASMFDCMRPEFDFTLEAAQMTAARAVAADYPLVSVPEVYRATPRVLVQSRAPGRALASADLISLPGKMRRTACAQLLAFMYRSYFVERVFHADPHPGNVFIDPQHGITLIDWGMVGRIDRTLGSIGVQLFISLAQCDAPGVASAWTQMGHAGPQADIAGFREDIARLVPFVAARTMADLNFGQTLATILKSACRRGIRTSPMMGMLGKSVSNIESTIRMIAPELSATGAFEEALGEVMTGLTRDYLSGTELAYQVVAAITTTHSGMNDLNNLLRDIATRDLTARAASTGRAGTLRRVVTPAAVAGVVLWWLRRHLAT